MSLSMRYAVYVVGLCALVVFGSFTELSAEPRTLILREASPRPLVPSTPVPDDALEQYLGDILARLRPRQPHERLHGPRVSQDRYDGRHVHYRQMFHDLPVWGGGLVAHLDPMGRVLSVTGETADPPALDDIPSLPPVEIALERLEAIVGGPPTAIDWVGNYWWCGESPCQLVSVLTAQTPGGLFRYFLDPEGNLVGTESLLSPGSASAAAISFSKLSTCVPAQGSGVVQIYGKPSWADFQNIPICLQKGAYYLYSNAPSFIGPVGTARDDGEMISYEVPCGAGAGANVVCVSDYPASTVMQNPTSHWQSMLGASADMVKDFNKATLQQRIEILATESTILAQTLLPTMISRWKSDFGVIWSKTPKTTLRASSCFSSACEKYCGLAQACAANDTIHLTHHPAGDGTISSHADGSLWWVGGSFSVLLSEDASRLFGHELAHLMMEHHSIPPMKPIYEGRVIEEAWADIWGSVILTALEKKTQWTTPLYGLKIPAVGDLQGIYPVLASAMKAYVDGMKSQYPNAHAFDSQDLLRPWLYFALRAETTVPKEGAAPFPGVPEESMRQILLFALQNDYLVRWSGYSTQIGTVITACLDLSATKPKLVSEAMCRHLQRVAIYLGIPLEGVNLTAKEVHLKLPLLLEEPPAKPAAEVPTPIQPQTEWPQESQYKSGGCALFP